MAQDQKHREQLEALLKFIEDLRKQPENKWFDEELKKRYGDTPNLSTISSIPQIDEIYEYCIEKVIQAQADDFYKDFPLEKIKKSLINDFVKMEHWRRRDNFQEFCMALWQQIEAITNHLANNVETNEAIHKLYGHPVFTHKAIKIADYVLIKQKNQKNQKNLLEKIDSKIIDLPIIDKTRCLLFLSMYQPYKTTFFDQNKYRYITENINSIYQYRNLNHRGSPPNDWQTKIYEKIDPKKSFYYFKFIGVLATFIEMVATKPIPSDEMRKYIQNLAEKKYTT